MLDSLKTNIQNFFDKSKKIVQQKSPVISIAKNNNILTPEKTKAILIGNPRYMEWYKLFEKYLPLYGINDAEEISRFLSQTCHESNHYKVLKENLNYSGERLKIVFPRYFKDRDINLYARKPEKIANLVYANRMGNGPESSGDGWKFRGRGVLQTTGKNNYTELSKSIGKTIEETTQYLETLEGALVSALFYWKQNNLNQIHDLTILTRKINGGTNGLTHRISEYNRILKILKGN